ARAEPLVREALAMYRRLFPPERFPAGHPHVAISLNNLGTLLGARGAHGQAEPLHRDALAMYRPLYPQAPFPDAHAHPPNSLNNLGGLLWARGAHAQAEPFHRDALTMYQALSTRLAGTAAEAEALNYAATLPLARDAFLSVSRGRTPDAAVYDLLWPTRSA